MMRTDLGLRRGLPEALCLICSPLLPFFWGVNVRVTNVEAFRIISEAVA